MKKLIFAVLIVTGVVLVVGSRANPYTENSYSGKYVSKYNTILELDKNDNCTIINTVYKDAFYSKGTYVVDNNEIKITFNKNKSDYYRGTLEGKVQGSKIKFADTTEDNIFVKQ